MKNSYEKINLNENVGLYWKNIEYEKDGQVKHLTQLVLRAKYRDELGDLKVNEINLSTKENYKALYSVKINCLNK